MKTIIKGIAILCLILLSANIQAQTFKTAIKVSKGQEYVYQNNTIMDINQTMGTQEMKVYNSSTSTTKNLINNITKKGNIEVVTSNWDVVTVMKMPMADTTKTENKGMVGPSYKVLLGKTGKPISREKYDTTNMAPGTGSIDLNNKLTSSGLFVEFPEKDIKIGDKWNKDVTDSVAIMGGNKMGVTAKTDYTLGGIETIDGKKLQKVTFTSNMELGGKMKMQGMEMFLEGTGVSTGTSYIEPVTKVIYKTETDIELDMTIAVTGQQSMTIPMNQKIKVTQTLKK